MIERRALIVWQLLIAAFAVPGGVRATYALSACMASDILGKDPGCPSAGGSCTITQQWTVGDGCTLDFNSRAVTIAARTGATISAPGPASITFLAGSFTVAAGALIDARGTSEIAPGNVGGAVTIVTTGAVNIQKTPNNAGRIDVSATSSAGDITISAGTSITVAGALDADRTDANHPLGDGGNIELDAGTDIITLTGSLISSFGGNTAPDGGGEIDLNADGKILLSGPIDVRGSAGGIVNITSGIAVSVDTIMGNASGDGGDGAAITVEAGTSLQLTALTSTSAITANGSDSPTFSGGGSGGAVSLTADFGDITLVANSDIHADGADGSIGGAGDGGEIDLIADGAVLIQKNATTKANLSATGGSPDGGGGLFDIEPNLNFDLEGTLDASGGGAGGEVDITAGSDALINGPITIVGGSPGAFGGTAVIAAGDQTSGALTISNTINLNAYQSCDLLGNGCGGGGTSTLSGCNVTITANGTVTANAPTGGSNFVTAYEQLTISGKLRAVTTLTTGDGTNTLVYPSRKPPVLAANAVLPIPSKSAMATCTAANQDNCLMPCPTCGNGIVEFPEDCDNDVVAAGSLPKSCDGCSAFCQFENCNDNKQCTTDSCDPRLGCLNVPVTFPCTEGPSPTPTPTPSVTHTPTTSATPTRTPTPTITATRTATPLASLTPTITASPTLTPTPVRPGGCAATPLADCRTPGISSLRLVNAVNKPKSKNHLAWRWRGLGGLTSISDFGNPVLGTTGYRICLYDASAGVPVLSFGALAPAGGVCEAGKPCWKPTRTGYKYVDGEDTPDGLARVVLTAGVQDKAKIVVTGVGPNLHMPPATGTAVLKQDSTVTVQFVRSDGGVCWQSVYGLPAKKNLLPVFKDVLP